MLRKRHRPHLADQATEPRPHFAHLDRQAVSMLGWLHCARVEFVLVGGVAAAIRGSTGPLGPVAIVPAPYRRNFERLAEALAAERVSARVEGAPADGGSESTFRLSASQLARGQLRTLRVGSHSLDIEGIAAGMPSYQELLYEANRFEVADGLNVEVASPEDLERYDHVRRTGIAPEIKITRARESDPAPTEAHHRGSQHG
jgi:hypothetical protein